MQMTITEEAGRHYKQEMDLGDGASVRLFVRIGGVGSGGFSIGVEPGEPSGPSYQTEAGGVRFFVEPQDQWYLDGMTISYHPAIDYLHFDNPRLGDTDHPNN
ncbi:HesB/YadR/YfhF family protein [uncultured Marinococcus sp.]|uniref:HesB/YadR/YfhF family protein n=1 Tax=uncultured Marinococcus sp. TaxID=487012 RepID=UPI002626E935|nr:iron-sulfur cluster biosynthesis family protein [uncultured Marinococcus sp.]